MADQSPYPKEGPISCADHQRIYLLGGSPCGWYSKHIYILDIDTRIWRREMTYKDPITSTRPRLQIGTSCVLINDHIYIFGGWKSGILNNDIYSLDLNTFTWKWLEPVNSDNQPMLKNKQGMVIYRDEFNKEYLLVFGGYGYPKFGCPLQRGANYELEEELMWTNEIHLFDIKERVWSVPPNITGTPPKPCAAFSFHYIDTDRVLLFGGRQKPGRVNEVHILDTKSWHWSGALLPTNPSEPWPEGRSFHTACSLIDPTALGRACITDDSGGLKYHKQCVLVLWGNDKDGEVLTDSWMLEIEGNSISWRKYTLPDSLIPRTWHTSVPLYVTQGEETIVFTFGGSYINLFTITDEPHLAASPSLMRYGCGSLYSKCQRAILSLYEDLSEVESFLPSHILRELRELKTAESHLKTIDCTSLMLNHGAF